jgi:hypothetical protein
MGPDRLLTSPVSRKGCWSQYLSTGFFESEIQDFKKCEIFSGRKTRLFKNQRLDRSSKKRPHDFHNHSEYWLSLPKKWFFRSEHARLLA